MLTLKDFGGKVLVSYFYEQDKMVPVIEHTLAGPIAKIEVIKGKKRGVIVSIGNGIIGWALCNTKDHWSPKGGWCQPDVFDKAKGIDLALQRAKIASKLTYRERLSFYSKVPFTLKPLFDEMNTRSQKYFQVDEIEGEPII